ncbi:hypothetical protein L7F22_057601 [Adiantum nelumboides]|nr:hypothetical protein [Adiantum nelumboides]MCO5603451.1 hypothetical protein [Adiantum nelumboides]
MGAVSTVYHAILSTGKAVAAKVFNNEMGLANERAFKKEVAILAKIRHKNIVRVWGCCFNLELKAILLELMPNGSLHQHLYNSPHQLTGVQKLRILMGVAQGLEYLHHCHPDGPIVHCDLKPQNILLDACFEACITDFGIATILKEVGSHESVSHLLRGSIGYIPPEYGYNVDVSTKGDVYSYGVVILELITCKSPTSAEVVEEGQTYKSWVKNNHSTEESLTKLNIGISSSTISKLFSIAMLCVQESPFDRPTILDTYRLLQDLCHAEETN